MVYIICAVGFFLILFFFDNFLDTVLKRFMGLFGFSMGNAEFLSFELNVRKKLLIILIKNSGKESTRIAAIRCGNEEGDFYYPTPYLSEEDFNCLTEKQARLNFSKKLIKSDQELSVILNIEELRSNNCQSLVIMDAGGNSKDIPNFLQLVNAD
ncbi:MAG: hypothetical protein MK172_06740 [Verrucomicrobiales bacterium]|nr:hypothetical protein [Verrucomicrobiales bacterium]